MRSAPGNDGKVPAFAGWQDWATTDPEKIRRWATANPTSNWGVYCGGSRLLVVDVDRKADEDGEAALMRLEMEHGTLPIGLRVRTPSGGLHIYLSGDGPSTVRELGTGLDTRGRGGLVLAPGSVARGQDMAPMGRYVIEQDQPIQPAPQWLLDLLKGTKKEPLERPADSQTRGSIGEGRRDVELTRWAGVLRGEGLTYDEMLAALDIMNRNRCDPPLSDEQVEKIARSIARKPTNEAKAAVEFGLFDPEHIESELQTSSPVHHATFSGPAPVREWIIPGWLPLGEITSLYGAGGLGKSLAALQLAFSVGTGSPWLGLPVQTQMPVMYVACEDSGDELHRRKASICGAPEFEFNASLDAASVYLWPRVGYENDIAREQDNDVVLGRFAPVLEEALSRMAEKGPKLLILDTLSDVYLGSENVRERVNKFVKTHLAALRDKYGLTVLILAHPSRTGANTGDMLSGSTAWENAVRNRWALSRSEEDESLLVLTRMKSNYSSRGDSLTLLWDHGRLVTMGSPPAARDVERQDVVLGLQRWAEANLPGEYGINSVAGSLQAAEPHLWGGASQATMRRRIEQALAGPVVSSSRLVRIASATHGSRTFLTVVVEEIDADVGEMLA